MVIYAKSCSWYWGYVKPALQMRSLALLQSWCQWGSQTIHRQTNAVKKGDVLALFI